MLKPLYSGVKLSISAAYSVIMTYAVRNKLSYSAINDLLGLLELFCPSSNFLPSSLYKLKKFFMPFTSNYKKTRTCAECEATVEEGSLPQQGWSVDTDTCGESLENYCSK